MNENLVAVDRRPRPAYKGRAERWRAVSVGLALLVLLQAWLLISAIRGNTELRLQIQAYDIAVKEN